MFSDLYFICVVDIKGQQQTLFKNKGIFYRLTFFFQVIEHEWRNLNQVDSFMLKLESTYNNKFPKNYNFGLRSLTLDNVSAYTDVTLEFVKKFD